MTVRPHMLIRLTLASTFGSAAIQRKKPANGPRDCFR